MKTFEKLVIRELGLDAHPELKNEYFKNYHRLVYLAQTEDSELRKKQKKRQISLNYSLSTASRVMGPWKRS